MRVEFWKELTDAMLAEPCLLEFDTSKLAMTVTPLRVVPVRLKVKGKIVAFKHDPARRQAQPVEQITHQVSNGDSVMHGGGL